ncbi:DUF4377 domain-containing protein [Gramella lutea]|uniref:DUF4377 domain-containing protein n=1 Tax=Christiangramia lutea TaxID=1607951 RepID=A0A9X1V1X7_9FLAO|nr:DUF4377 domain-containing protein [Christiangramia lutea]MCH4822877.1 DUF4377 domain-containing protein [Christiangramia lutea]
MKNKLHLAAIILSMFLLTGSACSFKGGPIGNVEIVELRVNHFKQTAIGLIPQLVLQIQEEEEIGTDNWSFWYDEIVRFDFEPGYVYDLKVRKIEVENPPQDESSIKYIMINVLSKEKVSADEQFKIGLKKFGENFIQGINPEYSLLYEYNIDCNSFCDQLEEKLDDPELTGNFIHGPDQSLILQSLN